MGGNILQGKWGHLAAITGKATRQAGNTVSPSTSQSKDSEFSWKDTQRPTDPGRSFYRQGHTGPSRPELSAHPVHTKPLPSGMGVGTANSECPDSQKGWRPSLSTKPGAPSRYPATNLGSDFEPVITLLCKMEILISASS